MNQAVDTLHEQRLEWEFGLQDKHPNHELIGSGYDEKTDCWWGLLFCPSEHKFLYAVGSIVVSSIKNVPDSMYGLFRRLVDDHLASLNFRTFEDVKIGQFFYPVGDEDLDFLMEKITNSSAKFHSAEVAQQCHRPFHPKAAVRLHLG